MKDSAKTVNYSEEQSNSVADLAVRRKLPKHDLKELVDFFDDDPLRYPALIRYLESKLAFRDSKTLVFTAFKLIIHDDLLVLLEWPDSL